MKRSVQGLGATGKAGATEPAPQRRGVDVGLVRALSEVLGAFDLSEIEITEGDLRIRLARHPAATAVHVPAVQASVVAPPPALPVPAAVSVPTVEHPGTVKSPMVGTAYRRASPEAKSLVEVGSQVKAGDRVLLVEAMKTFNDILAPRSGTITEIFVEDGQPVEYGEPLLVIE